MQRRLFLSAMAAVAAMPRVSAAATAHDFAFEAIEGQKLGLADFRGKAVLVVNTASFCGYTPQYAGLQRLWERYRQRGLVVLGVPSNDFGAQEPGTAQEIKRFCETNYSIDFPLTGKVAVVGAAAHPFYRWAASVLGTESIPRWNFHKYLVGPDGQLRGWFPTRVEPDSPPLIQAIEAALPR